MRVEITCIECGSGDLVVSGDFIGDDKRTVQIRCRNCNGKAKITLEVSEGSNFCGYLKVR